MYNKPESGLTLKRKKYKELQIRISVVYFLLQLISINPGSGFFTSPSRLERFGLRPGLAGNFSAAEHRVPARDELFYV